MIEPILTSDRDRRAWAWIVAQVGEDRARAVELAGSRKPYPSNVAKALGLRLPADLELTPEDQARERAAKAKAFIKRWRPA